MANTIKAMVGTIPGTLREVAVTSGETVNAVLNRADLSSTGYDIKINGEAADINTTITDAMIASGSLRIILAKQVKGNASRFFRTPDGVGEYVDTNAGIVYVNIGGEAKGYLPNEVTEVVTAASIDTTSGKKSSKAGLVTSKINLKDVFRISKVEDAALTLDGQIAIKNKAGQYVSFNEKNEPVDVGVALNLSSVFMTLPAQKVEAGDVVRVRGQFAKVVNVQPNGKIKAVKYDGAYTNFLPIKNAMFGGVFYEKLVDITKLGGAEGFNPMMLLALADDKEVDLDPTKVMLLSGAFGSGSFNPAMLLALTGEIDMTTALLLGGSFGGAQSGINPAMLLALTVGKDKGEGIDTTTLLALSGAFGGQAQTGFNPAMLLALGGDVDVKSLMLMQAFGGVNPFAPQTAPATPVETPVEE